MDKSKIPVFMALDVDSVEEAMALSKMWAPYIRGFKVGPRLGFQMSQAHWRELSQLGEVFVDYKFFDIPSTVESAVQHSFNLGASYATVHALNGEVALTKLAQLENQLNKERPFKILAVTLLTSFDQEKNALPLSEDREPQDLVATLASKVFESGLSAVVCSPLEVSSLQNMYKEGFFVCPGVRFASDEKEDQNRVSTPKEAWQNGASYLVMGRSLIGSSVSQERFETTLHKVQNEWKSLG